jgi:hypothetical protein
VRDVGVGVEVEEAVLWIVVCMDGVIGWKGREISAIEVRERKLY